MLILKGEKDMEKLDTTKKSVKMGICCVLWAKGLEKGHTCGVEWNELVQGKGGVGGWRH